jgi:CTP:molybdopterin cytidylyltransferase MocA
MENARYSEGMMSSVQAGICSLSLNADGFFILPGDMPLVRPGTYRTLAPYLSAGTMAVYPVFDGRKGHPPLISTRCVPGIMRCAAPGGLGSFLKTVRDRTTCVSVADPGVLIDMDTPVDYLRVLARLKVNNHMDREA